jgi:hypothetical protein
MSIKGSFSFILILLSGHHLAAQKTVSNQNLYWLRYFNQLSFNTKHSLHTEIEDRRFFEGNKQHHFIMHSRFNTKVYPNTEVNFGLTYSRQSPQDPSSKATLVVPEIRPNQEITYNNTISKNLSLQQRFRIDERFIRKNDGVTLLDGNNFSLRFRYRLMLAYKFNSELPLTLKLANELMINNGKQIVYNQYRPKQKNMKKVKYP